MITIIQRQIKESVLTPKSMSIKNINNLYLIFDHTNTNEKCS